jgi:hypothetical protein
MTNTNRAKIIISQRRGHLTTRVRYRALDLEGSWAVIVMIIILAMRFSWRILVIADKATGWLCWRVAGTVRIVYPVIARVTAVTARWAAHHGRGMILAFRAFYPL